MENADLIVGAQPMDLKSLQKPLKEKNHPPALRPVGFAGRLEPREEFECRSS
jgi:hypothetical protein